MGRGREGGLKGDRRVRSAAVRGEARRFGI